MSQIPRGGRQGRRESPPYPSWPAGQPPAGAEVRLSFRHPDKTGSAGIGDRSCTRAAAHPASADGSPALISTLTLRRTGRRCPRRVDRTVTSRALNTRPSADGRVPGFLPWVLLRLRADLLGHHPSRPISSWSG